MPENDPIMTALARIEAQQVRMEGQQSRMEAEQNRLREQVNDKLDILLDQISAIRQDTDAVRGHVLYGLQENLTLSQRITKLEDELRRR